MILAPQYKWLSYSLSYSVDVKMPAAFCWEWQGLYCNHHPHHTTLDNIISYLLQSIKDTVTDSSCKKSKMLQLSILLCNACQQIYNQYKMQSGKLASVKNQPEACSVKEFLTTCISLTLQRQNLWEIATAFYLLPKNVKWRTLKQVLKKAHQYSCKLKMDKLQGGSLHLPERVIHSWRLN